MSEFRAGWMILARERRGLSRSGLAQLMGVSDRRLAQIEKEGHVPSEALLAALSMHLHVRPSFFFGGEIELLSSASDEGNASFRARKALGARKRRAVLAAGNLGQLLDAWLDVRFPRRPNWDLAWCSSSATEAGKPSLARAELVAESLRAAWGLGGGPVKQFMPLLEGKGVRVIRLPDDVREVDAFCFWRDKKPFVVYSPFFPGERQRFDLGHELGHLVLHRGQRSEGREAEAEANRFAACFLIPRAAAQRELPRRPHLGALLDLKQRWGMSAAALLRRGYDIRLYSEWQYKNACIQLSKRGWRSGEPGALPDERSRFWQLALARGRGVALDDAASDLGLRRAELEALVPPPLSEGGVRTVAPSSRSETVVQLSEWRRQRTLRQP